MKPDPWVNVGNPDGPLNLFQRRLMHQLIREEFPALKCINKNDGAFMQVMVLDHEKEAKVGLEFQNSGPILENDSNIPQYQAKKLIEHNDKIAKQKGVYTTSLEQFSVLTNHRLDMDLRGFGRW